MRAALLALILLLGVRSESLAEEDVGRLAREAAEALGNAAAGLAAAEAAPDRIAALTETIRAYEVGLSAMREGLREAALREREAAAALAGEEGELSALLAMLQKVTRAGKAQSVLHPGGAIETVRAGLLTSTLVPALEERTGELARDLSNLEALRTVQQAGIETLEEGHRDLREARLKLSTAILERTDLPPLVATDQAAMEAVINSAETLAAFADSLVSEGDVAGNPAEPWEMPVIGKVVRDFDEADPAGVRRPGWTIATAAEALVTAPADASVRYVGNMPGSGPVTILETAPGTLVILNGYSKSFVRLRQIVSGGEPIALMGGSDVALPQENLNKTPLVGGQPRDETLYIEIRQGQAPVDPAAFLRPKQNKESR